MRNGPEWFLGLGKPNNGGAKVFSVSGHVAKPGNYEVRLGTPFSELLEMAGGMRAGRTLKAVIPGGSRSEEHTSELQSLMRISYAVFCLKKNKNQDGNDGYRDTYNTEY